MLEFDSPDSVCSHCSPPSTSAAEASRGGTRIRARHCPRRNAGLRLPNARSNRGARLICGSLSAGRRYARIRGTSCCAQRQQCESGSTISPRNTRTACQQYHAAIVYTAEIDHLPVAAGAAYIFGSECISVQPLRTPKSSTGQTSTRPSSNIRNISDVQRPMPRTVVRREMTSSSSSSPSRSNGTVPSVALVARSMIDAVLLPDRPAVRNTSGVTASTAWGVTLPPIAWTNRPWIACAARPPTVGTGWPGQITERSPRLGGGWNGPARLMVCPAAEHQASRA